MSDPALPAISTEPGEETLAGLWSFTLQALVARAAHEVNNALNGAVVNVEVVKARARPGADAGTAAPFAEAASSELEELATLTEALLSLSRPPRGTTDAALIARHATALLAPGLVRLRVRIELSGERSCPAGGDPTAVRLAVVSGLLAAVDGAARMAETAGTDSAVEPTQRVGCTTLFDDSPTVEIAPRYGATLPPVVVRALSAVDVVVSADSEMLRIALPKRAEPY